MQYNHQGRTAPLFDKVSNAMARLYSLRLLLALFAGVAFFFWLFNFSALPLSNPALKQLSNGEELLDARLYYPAQEAFRAMERYGAEGRALYLRFLAADFVFLAIYGLAFSLLLSRLAIALFGPSTPWIKVNLLPLGIAFADCAENVCLLLLLTAYPDRNVLIGTLAGVATMFKWTLTAVTLIGLAAAGFYALRKHFRLGRR